MLADSWGTTAVRDRRRAELCKGPRIPKRLVQLRMLQWLPIVAGGKLRTVDNLSNGGNRGDEQAACERRAKQFGFGFGSGECLHDQFESFVLGDRLLPGEQQFSVRQPVLVACGLVTEALLVYPLHQPAC